MSEKVEVKVIDSFYDKTCFKRLRNRGDVYECAASRAQYLANAGFVDILQGEPPSNEGEPEDADDDSAEPGSGENDGD